ELDHRDGPDRFFPYWEVYPVTAVLRFDASGAGASGPLLELHDPLRSAHVETAAGLMPLAADLTPPPAPPFARGRLPSYRPSSPPTGCAARRACTCSAPTSGGRSRSC